MQCSVPTTVIELSTAPCTCVDFETNYRSNRNKILTLKASKQTSFQTDHRLYWKRTFEMLTVRTVNSSSILGCASHTRNLSLNEAVFELIVFMMNTKDSSGPTLTRIVFGYLIIP